MPIELPTVEPCPFCENIAGRGDADTYRIKRWAFVDRAVSLSPLSLTRFRCATDTCSS